MRSMTGLGQASGENTSHAITVTLRGVNHRYLDLKLHLDEPYRASETALRDLLTTEVSRGRLEAGVEIRGLEPRRVAVEVERGALETIHAAVHRLAQEGFIDGELAAGDLLRMPEVFRVNVTPDRWTAEDEALLLEVAGRALEQLVAARRREGETLARVLEERRAALAALAEELDGQRGQAVAEMRQSLERRLEELLAGRSGLDPARLEQEVALLAERSDISEELDRLRSHLEHFRELAARPGAVGKRLDFLCQEILRELNTLGSKARNALMVRSVVEAKALSEQLREQVQNVE